MGKITVQEPKSVVEEVEKYECDECKQVVDEEGINTTVMFTGDAVGRMKKVSEGETKHLCEDCIGLRHALEVREKKDYLQARWRAFRGWVNPLLVISVFGLGGTFFTSFVMSMGWIGMKIRGEPNVWLGQGFFAIPVWVFLTFVMVVCFFLMLDMLDDK